MHCESIKAGLPLGAAEALADPIVQALMAADRVDSNGLETLLRRVAVRLARQEPATCAARGGGASARYPRYVASRPISASTQR
jgi:hypothetical protein